jgi:hypothetical protein
MGVVEQWRMLPPLLIALCLALLLRSGDLIEDPLGNGEPFRLSETHDCVGADSDAEFLGTLLVDSLLLLRSTHSHVTALAEMLLGHAVTIAET